MNADLLTSSASAAPHVWDRLWRYEPSPQRDDALLAREGRSVRWSLVRRRLLETFGRLDGLETIELGSGRGDLSVLLARAGAKVTLLDASEQGLAQARRRFDRLGLEGVFVQGDLLGSLGPWRGRFDVSVSTGVIEHFLGSRRTDAVRAHYEVLRPNGMTMISVPHAWCPSYRMWKLYLELRGWWPYGVEVPYSRKELDRRADHAGFTRSETTGVGWWQSVGDHVLRPLWSRGPDWVDRPSVLDSWLGLSALLFAWK